MSEGQKNAANKKQVKDAGSAEKRRRERELNDMRKVLSTREGRRFVWRYLGECHVFKISFTGNSETFFNEGMRNIGLMLMADVNESDPDSYLKMMKEAKENDDV